MNEQEEKPGGWTVDTLHALLREYDRRYDQRFDAQEKAVQAALASAALAVEKAESDADRWRANANEWRAAMNDREQGFMGRGEANTQFNAIQKQIAELTKSRDQSEGRTGGIAAGWGYLVGFIGLVAAIVSLFIALTQG